MAIQNYSTVTARIGKLKGEILAHAMPVEVLGITGSQKQMPKNQSDTVVFRRYLPYGGTDNKWITGSNVGTFATDHITQEGVTPSADTLSATDITVTLNQYSVLYAVTDKTVDLYEDDVPSEMKKQTGERIGLVREMVRYGALKACTNAFYAGGSSVATTDETLTLNFLRKIARNLLGNHAKQITSILAASPNFATAPVEAGFLVFVSTDMEPAIRDLPGFKHVSEYGSRKPVHEMEVGSVERFRFITSPELAPTLGANGVTAAVGATGLLDSASSGYIDVYPCIVVAEDAWGQVALRGMDSIDVTYLPPGQKDKNDPLGQRGYIGAKTYMAASVLNNGWMALAYAGTPSLA
jgi:N4-gp56 family major capsid protein